MQSDPLTTSELIVIVVSLTAFTGAVGFCLSNAIRFWRLRTYHMGLFYVMALLNLLSRCGSMASQSQVLLVLLFYTHKSPRTERNHPL
jgi:uncharacterized membrane protein